MSAPTKTLLRHIRRYLQARTATGTGQKTDAERERVLAEEREIQIALEGLIDARIALKLAEQAEA